VLFFSDPSNGRPGLGATIRLTALRMPRAHEQAKVVVQRLSGNRQNPEIEKPRSEPYLRGDNQDEKAASIRMRMRRGGVTEGGRSPTDGSPPPAAGFSEPVWRS